MYYCNFHAAIKTRRKERKHVGRTERRLGASVGPAQQRGAGGRPPAARRARGARAHPQAHRDQGAQQGRAGAALRLEGEALWTRLTPILMSLRLNICLNSTLVKKVILE